MFINYGGCAMYLNQRSSPIINDYLYVNNNGAVTLLKYIGNKTTIITPNVRSA